MLIKLCVPNLSLGTTALDHDKFDLDCISYIQTAYELTNEVIRCSDFDSSGPFY